jgi:hypothetical protein
MKTEDERHSRRLSRTGRSRQNDLPRVTDETNKIVDDLGDRQFENCTGK